MGTQRRSQAEMHKSCQQVHDDDGIPSRHRRIGHRRQKPDYHLSQLCQQVFEALTYILADGDVASPLDPLRVVTVVPAPDCSRLAVILWPDTDPASFNLARTLDTLERSAGRIRCEVAASISRKKAPSLVFQVLDPKVMLGEWQ